MLQGLVQVMKRPLDIRPSTTDLRLSFALCSSVSGSVVSDFVIPWNVARQAPPSMGFSRQGCWSGLPFCFPEIRYYEGIFVRIGS